MPSIKFTFPPQSFSLTTEHNNDDNDSRIYITSPNNNQAQDSTISSNNKTKSDSKNDIVIEERNPTTSENLSIGTVWINKTTGEVFICVDDTPDKNKWVGSFGTVIEPNSFYLVDFFKDNSIVAFYRFNYSTNDETGLFHGFKFGASSYTKGRYDRALDFGEIPNNINAFVVKNIALYPEMNFSFWVYKYSNNQINSYLSLAYADIYNAILLFEHDGIFKIIIDNHIYAFHNSSYIPVHEWVFISLNIFRNPKKVDLYINGEYVSTVYYITDFAPEKFSLNNCLVFGQDQDTYCGGFDITQSFLGKLDQFRIFKRTLTPDEIKQLYNEEP